MPKKLSQLSYLGKDAFPCARLRFSRLYIFQKIVYASFGSYSVQLNGCAM